MNIPHDLKRRLSDIAGKLGITVSEAVRLAVVTQLRQFEDCNGNADGNPAGKKSVSIKGVSKR